MTNSVTDSTVSDAAEGVFVGVEPANRVVSSIPTTNASANPDPTPAQAQAEEAPAQPSGFTEADLAKAREQEKAKLYPQMEQLKSELSELKREREEQAEAERQAREEAERLAKEQAEEEMSVRELLKVREQEWEQRLEQERIERENALAMLNKEREYAQITEYRNARLSEVGDDIIPELRDLVTGNTIEEIDQSIAGLVERSSRILEGAQQAIQSQRQAMQGTRVTAPPTELDTNSAQQQLTPEQIAAMSPQEWGKVRHQVLGQVGTGTNRGLFG